MNNSKPIFIKLDKHKEIIDIMDVIDRKVVSAKQMLAELEGLKKKEDDELAKWQSTLEEIEHKIGNVKEEIHD